MKIIQSWGFIQIFNYHLSNSFCFFKQKVKQASFLFSLSADLLNYTELSAEKVCAEISQTVGALFQNGTLMSRGMLFSSSGRIKHHSFPLRRKPELLG